MAKEPASDHDDLSQDRIEELNTLYDKVDKILSEHDVDTAHRVSNRLFGELMTENAIAQGVCGHYGCTIMMLLHNSLLQTYKIIQFAIQSQPEIMLGLTKRHGPETRCSARDTFIANSTLTLTASLLELHESGKLMQQMEEVFEQEPHQDEDSDVPRAADGTSTLN